MGDFFFFSVRLSDSLFYIALTTDVFISLSIFLQDYIY